MKTKELIKELKETLLYQDTLTDELVVELVKRLKELGNCRLKLKEFNALIEKLVDDKAKLLCGCLDGG